MASRMSHQVSLPVVILAAAPKHNLGRCLSCLGQTSTTDYAQDEVPWCIQAITAVSSGRLSLRQLTGWCFSPEHIPLPASPSLCSEGMVRPSLDSTDDHRSALEHRVARASSWPQTSWTTTDDLDRPGNKSPRRQLGTPLGQFPLSMSPSSCALLPLHGHSVTSSCLPALHGMAAACCASRTHSAMAQLVPAEVRKGGGVSLTGDGTPRR